MYCRVFIARRGEQTVLKYEDATCLQLFRERGLLVNVSPCRAVELSVCN